MPPHVDELRLTARALPETSGVYFWEDEGGRPLYIGKAINLRSRVTSYFSTARRDRRVRELVTSAARIRHECTSTELEALFRESALIKTHRPPYNRALLTSKPAFYLKIDRSRPDPYLEVSRGIEGDMALYFGPFRSGRALREIVAFLHDVLPLRKCAAQKPRCKPCVYYQMHKCAAPALDEIHRQRHEEAILRLYDLLEGREDRVRAWLEAKRDRLSESLLFERAAEIQDRLNTFAEIQEQNALLEAAMQCRCVLVHHVPRAGGESKLLLVAHGHVVSTRELGEPDPDAIAAWIRVHDPVIQGLRYKQSPVDAALVFKKWITTNRKHARWVAFHDLGADDLVDGVRYVLNATSDARAAT